MIWKVMAERTYRTLCAVEVEAQWAGRTEGMTQAALEACATGKMWEIYPPTPMTNEC